jgi:hypothetical protein
MGISQRLCPKIHPDPHLKKPKTPDPWPVVMEDFDDGWPGYEEPVIIYH